MFGSLVLLNTMALTRLGLDPPVRHEDELFYDKNGTIVFAVSFFFRTSRSDLTSYY